MTTKKNNMGRNCNCTKSMVKYRQEQGFFNTWNIGLWNSCWDIRPPTPPPKGLIMTWYFLVSNIPCSTSYFMVIFNKKPLYSYNYFEVNIISLFLWRCTFSWCLSYILCCCGRTKCHTLLQCFWETLSSTYLDQSWWLGSSVVTNFNFYCE